MGRSVRDLELLPVVVKVILCISSIYCLVSKHVQTSHKSSLLLKFSPLELIHSDVCQMPELSLGAKKYSITFVDDATRKVWVHPIHSKDEVLDKFKKILVGDMCARPFRYFVTAKG